MFSFENVFENSEKSTPLTQNRLCKRLAHSCEISNYFIDTVKKCYASELTCRRRRQK